MADFTVVQRGTDTSGRALFATRYMWAWWDQVCATLGFTPTVVQGAFMGRAGGGAAASAGYHDGGGCFDLRTWDRTPTEVDQVIRTLRSMGAAAWVRDARHGMDPHIHFVLGTDQPLNDGAAWQWQSYLDGRDGLSAGGRDYHPRPTPLVLTPPEDIMATKAELAELLDSKLAPIEQLLRGSRERERQTRAKANEAVRKLDRLAEEVTDDATKAQVRAVRADIADLGAEPEVTGV